MKRFFLLPFLLVSLAACETTEEVADTTADTAEDVADATADVAEDVYDAGKDVVTSDEAAAVGDAADTAFDATTDAIGDAAVAVADAAGDTWDATTDLFDDDPELDAAALVRPTTAAGANAEGTVRFMEMDGGLMVAVSLSGLSPGEHGLHIHRNPACGPADTDGDGTMEPAGAAGSHWDPHSTDDHGAPGEDVPDKHLGDLGNITAGADGTVETTIMVPTYNASEHNVAGHAVVVHMGRDDLETDPSGGAGTPQGCGVIEGRM